MKQHVKLFPVDLYKRGVCVFLGTREQFKAYLEREEIDFDWDGEDTDKMLDKYQAVTLRTDTDCIIYSDKEVDEGVLAHECVHAAKHVLRIVGVEDEEAEAYLVEYLYNGIIPWVRSIQKHKGVRNPDEAHWIPASIPPQDTNYVFTCSDDDGTPQCLGVGYYDGTAWKDSDDEEYNVDYWMEVPSFQKEQ